MHRVGRAMVFKKWTAAIDAGWDSVIQVVGVRGLEGLEVLDVRGKNANDLFWSRSPATLNYPATFLANGEDEEALKRVFRKLKCRTCFGSYPEYIRGVFPNVENITFINIGDAFE
eukprot:GHVU01074566.1.p2 GENE.GHVU01074566.1~~GHVU01074566.1.p2  ORF type:complete len:115 (-),score=9.05 GHVU01074566.1:151-495(-)